MAMSKRNFEQLATLLGLEFRWTAEEDKHILHNVIHNAIIPTLRTANPSFDSVRFLAWVDDVRTGKRDAEGKKVKNG